MNNILHVVNIPFAIPYFLGKQIPYFINKGYKEYVICSPSNELELLSKKYGFEYKAVDILRKMSIGKDLNAVIVTARYIKKNEIDIVVGHTPKGALIAMLAAYFTRVHKRIYFRHGLVYETSKGFKRWLLVTIDRITARLATKVICVSPSICRRSLEDRLNSEAKQMMLLKGTCNGIDVMRFCRMSIDDVKLAKLRIELGIDESNFVIGFTGRLVRDKGIIELVQAFNELQNKYSNIILLLVGMVEERDALPDDIVNCINSNHNIINTGYVKNSNIEYYYALMNIFVLPSYREGLPTSVLEASAMSIPVITTKVTGCIDSIIENVTGTFVEHNSLDLIDKIETLYCKKELGCRWGVNGRKFVVDNFNQDLVWKEIEKIYR